MPPVLTRPQWTSYRPSLQAVPCPLRYCVVHHTVSRAGPDMAAFMRETEAFHRNRRGMIAIAYNFLHQIAFGLVIAEGRGWCVRGGHTTNYNSTAHAFSIAANTDVEEVPDVVIHGIADMIRDGVRAGHVARDLTVIGHRDVDSTACPGFHAYRKLPMLRNILSEGLPAPTPVPAPTPGVKRAKETAMLFRVVADPYNPTEAYVETTGGDILAMTGAQFLRQVASGRTFETVNRAALDRMRGGRNPDTNEPVFNY